MINDVRGPSIEQQRIQNNLNNLNNNNKNNKD
jgi:hypothetical protein